MLLDWSIMIARVLSIEHLLCRKCGCCVMDMDHHCFFLNNCVGRNNLKPFLLFLSWMLLGSLYIIICVLILVFRRRHEILEHLALPGSGQILLFWGKQCYYTVIVARGWMQTCAFLLTTATAAAVGVFALLKSQLSLLLAGKTYISSLRHGQNAAAQQIPKAQLLKLLLSQNPLSWLCPTWQTNLHPVSRKSI